MTKFCRYGEIGRHSGLKIRRFERTGSSPVTGTNLDILLKE